MKSDVNKDDWRSIETENIFKPFNLDQIKEDKKHEAFDIMQRYYIKYIQFAEGKYSGIYDSHLELFNTIQYEIELLSFLKKFIDNIQVQKQKEIRAIKKVDTMISNKLLSSHGKYNLEEKIKRLENYLYSKNELASILRIRITQLLSSCSEEDLKTTYNNLHKGEDEIEINIMVGFSSLLNQTTLFNPKLVSITLNNYQDLKNYMEAFNNVISRSSFPYCSLIIPFTDYIIKFNKKFSNFPNFPNFQKANMNILNLTNNLNLNLNNNNNNSKLVSNFFQKDLNTILDNLVKYLGKIDPEKSAPLKVSQKYKHLINYGKWAIAAAELILCDKEISEIRVSLMKNQNRIIKGKREASIIYEIKSGIDFFAEIKKENEALESLKTHFKNIMDELINFVREQIPNELDNKESFFSQINSSLAAEQEDINDLYLKKLEYNNLLKISDQNLRRVSDEVINHETSYCRKLCNYLK